MSGSAMSGSATTGGEPRIRPAGAADLAAITAVQVASFADQWSIYAVRQLVAMHGAVALIAERPSDAAIMGYLIGQVVTDEAEVHSIAVAAEHRRRGIGRGLLRAFEGVAAGLGAVSAVLEVAADDLPARTLYESIGYRVVARRSGYYRVGRPVPVDAEICRRTLR